MKETLTAPPGVAGEGYWMIDRCPGCGNGYLYTVHDGKRTNLLCRVCSRCWSVGEGWVRRVDPVTCPGCEWRSTCLSRHDRPAPADADAAIDFTMAESGVSGQSLGPVLPLVPRSPVQVLLDTPLREVAAVMAEEAIGAVLVRGPHGPAGIVTERDIVAALAEGADPDQERARDVMTADLAVVSSTETVLTAAELLLAHEIRHLPVTAGLATVGVVSIRDVLAAVVDDVGRAKRPKDDLSLGLRP